MMIDSLNARAEQRHLRDVRDRVRAAGEAADVVLCDAGEDLAEGERDDGEVVAAHPQGRRAHDRAEAARHHRADDHDDRERQLDADLRRRRAGQVRRGERADAEERDVAEVEQAREPDDDVEPDRGGRVDADVGRDRHPVLGARRGQRKPERHGEQHDHAERAMPLGHRGDPAQQAGRGQCRERAAERAEEGEEHRARVGVDHAALPAAGEHGRHEEQHDHEDDEQQDPLDPPGQPPAQDGALPQPARDAAHDGRDAAEQRDDRRRTPPRPPRR